MKDFLKIGLLVILYVPVNIFADIIYLKDGKVYEHAVIDEASAVSAKFTTKTKEKISLVPGTLLRLRYGEDELETVSILMKDGVLIDGFLVEQDSRTVLIRRVKDKNNEELLEKSLIQQMSKNKIVVVYPEMDVRGGVFFPLNSGGANLGLGFIGLLGFYINPPFWPGSKIGIEGGYALAKSTTNQGMEMHFIPVLVNIQYLFKVSKGNSMEMNVAPRIGFGGSYIIFNDGEGGTFQSMIPGLSAGVGFYMILVPRKFFINAFADYLLLLEGQNALHSLTGTLAVQFRI